MDINAFRQRLIGGGARGTLFEIKLAFPSYVGGVEANEISLLAKAAALPSSDLGTIQVGHMGRFIKQPGDRIYQPWSVTIINDESLNLRRAFESWGDGMEKYTTAGGTPGPGTHRFNLDSANMNNYTTTVSVTQFDKNRRPIYNYQLKNAFPSLISDIPLAWDATDTIEEFQVTFEYDFYTSGNGADGTQGASN